MTFPAMPPQVDELVARLAAVPGVVAVALGGSRAAGRQRADSDWDLGVYYRGGERCLDPDDVRALGYTGEVSGLGAWGPIVNGGAWLTVEGIPLASRREWALHEKRLVERAGLLRTEALVIGENQSFVDLAATVTQVSAAIGVDPLQPR
jgi:hypothetical protein